MSFCKISPAILFELKKYAKFVTLWSIQCLTCWLYIEICKIFSKTQGKNSRFRQRKKPGLPKMGRKNKPDIHIRGKIPFYQYFDAYIIVNGAKWPLSAIKCYETPKVSIVQSHFTRNGRAITSWLLEIPNLRWALIC